MSSYEQRRSRTTRRQFGMSWWGEAWVEAVEKRARLDGNRLPRGKTYARWGYVGDLTVQRGSVTALVDGSRPTPYRTHVRVRPFSDDEWDRLFDVVASKVAHAAVLADGELSPDLVDDASAVGIELLPTEGEINTGCSCADDANPCKHGAAVCYLIADLLDEDPFVLLHMRGKTQEQVTDGLRAKRVSAAPAEDKVIDEEEGIDALAAYSLYTGDAPWPKVPRPNPRPGTPAALPPDMPKDTDVEAGDLLSLAADAARRAWELSNGIGDGGLGLYWYYDIVRRAVPLLETPDIARLSRTARVPQRELEEDARLWRAGGQEALEDVANSWPADRRVLSLGIHALEPGGEVTIRDNKVTCEATGQQLRLSEAGRWYRFEKHGTHWRFVKVETENALSALRVFRHE